MRIEARVSEMDAAIQFACGDALLLFKSQGHEMDSRADRIPLNSFKAIECPWAEWPSSERFRIPIP